MNVERYLRLIAGCFVFATLLLSYTRESGRQGPKAVSRAAFVRRRSLWRYDSH